MFKNARRLGGDLPLFFRFFVHCFWYQAGGQPREHSWLPNEEGYATTDMESDQLHVPASFLCYGEWLTQKTTMPFGRPRFGSDGTIASSKDVERILLHCFSRLVNNHFLSGLTEVFLHARCIPHQNSQRCFWASVCEHRVAAFYDSFDGKTGKIMTAFLGTVGCCILGQDRADVRPLLLFFCLPFVVLSGVSSKSDSHCHCLKKSSKVSKLRA